MECSVISVRVPFVDGFVGVSDARLFHSRSVAYKCYWLARDVFGYGEGAARVAYMAGWCHDAGHAFAPTQLDHAEAGGGVQAVSEAVSRACGRVVGVETVYACEGREYDVLDASDVTTISGTVMVVRDSGGAVCRVPYLPPFVDVTRFASVPAGRVGEFERAIVGVLKRFRVGAYVG